MTILKTTLFFIALISLSLFTACTPKPTISGSVFKGTITEGPNSSELTITFANNAKMQVKHVAQLPSDGTWALAKGNEAVSLQWNNFSAFSGTPALNKKCTTIKGTVDATFFGDTTTYTINLSKQ